eukprot:2715022-Pleurochrysis_carterae.AAC.1
MPHATRAAQPLTPTLPLSPFLLSFLASPGPISTTCPVTPACSPSLFCSPESGGDSARGALSTRGRCVLSEVACSVMADYS